MESETIQKEVDAVRWVDATSYSRGERGNVEPRTWNMKVGSWLFIITKHRDWGDEWVLICRDFGVECKRLGTTNSDEAKAQAWIEIQDAQMETLRKFSHNSKLLSSAFKARPGDFMFFPEIPSLEKSLMTYKDLVDAAAEKELERDMYHHDVDHASVEFDDFLVCNLNAIESIDKRAQEIREEVAQRGYTREIFDKDVEREIKSRRDMSGEE